MYPMVVISLTASAAAVAAGAGVTAGVGARIIAPFTYFAEPTTASNEATLVYAMASQTWKFTKRGIENHL
jgi:hypothetical protein